MEIMHSKFLKLQTALLTLLLLFSVLLPQTALAAGDTTDAAAAQDTVTLVDPSTFNSWEKIQGTRSITQGRIWADKTVSANEIGFSPNSPLGKAGQTVTKSDGSDFLVALSALSSTSSLTKPEPQPIDIVLVLDVSASMDNPMGSTDNAKRIDSIKKSVNTFLDEAEKRNAEIEDTTKQIKVALVKFAGNSSDSVGDDKYYTEGHWSNEGYYIDSHWSNYSQVVKESTTDIASLKASVEALTPNGATRSDYGMKMAQKVLGSARSNAKKVVIFFTDGKPTSLNKYDPEVAGDAINTAKAIKDSGTTIYTVGIFEDANATADPTADHTSDENRFMHAVSSNYPAAASSRGGWGGTLGTRAENSSYYKTATNSTELNAVFQDIFKDATSDPPVPTLVESGKDATNSGYVTFEDPLGDYMTVTDFNAIAFSDTIYTNPTKETAGNVTTYTFTGTNTGNVAYPKNVDLDNIIIEVTRDDDLKIGDKVKVEIPAALLPLRYYNIAEDKDGKISMEITPTYPIHVFYSVSLKDAAKRQMESGVITDTALASYVAAHTEEDGKVYFYSNLYTGARTGTDAEGKSYTAGNTTASFLPAESNSFYYYTEDTLLYEDEDCKIPAKNVQPNTPYYYDLPYYEIGKVDASGSLEELHSHIKISIATQPEIEKALKVNSDGIYYVPEGTLKGSYPQALDNQVGPKDNNITKTASRRIDFGWDNKYTIGRLYLGNNGKIGYNATGSLKITKTVAKADPSYSPDAETPFLIKVDLEGNGANGSYTYTIDGNASDPHQFTSGGVIALKDGQTVEIEGLPAGCQYTVSEPTLPDGYTLSTIENGTGTIVAGLVKDTAAVVTVQNTYTPNSYTLDGGANLSGKKVLSGRDWQSRDKFTFYLEAISPDNAPMPNGAYTSNGKSLARIELTRSDGTKDGTEVPFRFGDITYTKPGTYRYRIYEETPSNADRLPGIDYDTTTYTVTVKIKDNGNGQLELDSVTKALDTKDNVTEMPADNIPLFKNIFKAETEEINFVATKVYKDNAGNSINPDENQFQFTLSIPEKDASGNAVTETNPPMPTSLTVGNDDGGQVSFGKVTYTADNVGHTYWYQMSEINGVDARIDYDAAAYLIRVEVGSETGTDNKLIVTSNTTYYKQDENGAWQPVDINTGDDVASKITFTNTLTPTPTSAKLWVCKRLEGRKWMDGDTFTFILTPKDGAPMPEGENANKLTITNASSHIDDNGRTGSFGDITYTKPGTYVYTISEDTVTLPGFKNHPGKITATVTVKREGNELIVSGVNYKDASGNAMGSHAYFTNTYAADPAVLDGKAKLSVSKTLLGREWGKEEAFKFEIAVADDSDEGTPLPASTILTLTNPNLDEDTATGHFGDITYTKAGNYSYAIREVHGTDKPNTDNKAAITQWDNSVYTVKVTVEDNGTGKLNIKLFSVEKSGDDNYNGISFTNRYEPSPDPVKTVTDGSGNSIDDTLVSPGQELTYTIHWVNNAVNATGKYTDADITITDTVPANTSLERIGNGGTEDENHKITWKIKAEPNQSGTVSFTVKVNETITGANGEIDNTAQVGNRTTNITHNYLPGKTVDKDANATIKVGDELTYTITYKNLEKDAATVTVTDKVPAGTEFVSAYNNGVYENGTVTWNLADVASGKEGTVSFKVRVTIDAVGNAIENQAEVKIGARAPAQTTKTTTKAVEEPSPAKVTLTAHKTLVSDVGSHTLAASEFSFNLLDKDGNLVQTAANDDKGNVTFDELKLDTIGDYTYTICEVNGKLGYMTYDTSKYTVSFKVYDAQNGTLAATAPVYSLSDKAVDAAEFTNHYTAELPKDASFSLSATKTLTGRSMIKGEFAFTLEDESGNIVATARNDAEGNIVFSKVGLKDVQEAYTALMAAAEPAQPVVEPTPVEDEQPVQIEDGEQATPETAVAAYSLEDAPAVMTDAETEPAVDTDAVQKLLTRWYTIREYAQGKDGVTYDSNTYMVRVQLADKEGLGTLTVDSIQFFAADGETPLENSDVVFANSYAAEGVDLTVTASKQLTGRSLAEGEFSFRLSCNDDPANEQTVTSDANGRITFALHYDDKDGTGTQETHTYTVTEVHGDNDTITYDDTAYTFTVEVIDDGEGHLTTKVTQPEAMIFRNVYTPKATSITLAGNKVLNGRAQKADEFTFELCDANGAVIATATNGENGYFAFGTLTYDKAGTYTYTVREKNTGVSRVTYDSTVYSVTVQVRDEDGQLKADIILPASGLTFTNTYTPEPAPTPAPTPKPTTTPAPVATAAPTPAPVRIPQTADSFPLALLIGLLAVSGGALAVLLTARKRGKK